MSGYDDEQDWHHTGERINPNRFLPVDVACYALAWVSSMLEATAELADGIKYCLGGHANYTRDRDNFAASAGLEIETLTSAPEEDA